MTSRPRISMQWTAFVLLSLAWGSSFMFIKIGVTYTGPLTLVAGRFLIGWLTVSLLLWRSGPLGALRLMYTPEAMILAQLLIALPLVVGITLAAVGALDESFHLQVRTLGVPPLRRVWLLLREILLGLLAAVIAALGGILSEVGAVLAVGGNLEGETRVLTTAILMYTQRGEFELAIALSAVLFGLMLALAGALTAVQQGGRR